jgi:hypothetical protein
MKTLVAVMMLWTLPARAQIDDSELSGRSAKITAESSMKALPLEGRREGKTLIFPLTMGGPVPVRGGAAPVVSGVAQLADRAGAWLPARLSKIELIGPGASSNWIEADSLGRFSFPAAGLSGNYRLHLSLDNQFWTFAGASGQAYVWESPEFSLKNGASVDVGNLRPDPSSENGKLGVLYLTYLDAIDFLKKEATLSWWKTPLKINWPGSGDYFGGWELNITDAQAWDVDLHEFGHAVMDGAMNADMGGGKHKIDECYSQALAFSEGWATFFAAAVRLSKDDADAKFEFLVPRRAPIRLENVPEDVCKGTNNEWRVSAGLWDLIDTHADGGDHFTMEFPRLWKALTSGHIAGFEGAWKLIQKELKPLEQTGAHDALAYNTLLAPKKPLLVNLPPVPADWAAPR